MNTNQLATHFSLKAFMNSLLRDYNECSSISVDEKKVCLSLGKGETVEVGLKCKSLLGKHEYTGDLRLQKEGGTKPLDFEAFVSLVTEKLLSSNRTEEFLEAVRNGRQMTQAILGQPSSQDEKSWDYMSSEQSLFLGHPFHPYPKAKMGMSAEDVKKYSPEFQNTFSLFWVAVNERVFSFTSFHQEYECWNEELFAHEFSKEQARKLSREGFRPFPMHPWQAEQLSKREFFRKSLENGTIVKLGEGAPEWMATSSLRSVYSHKAPYSLKFSMDVKLTNSVRHLEINEAIRGGQISSALRSEGLKPFFDSHQNFSLLYEPAFAGIVDEKTGDVLKESLVVCRDRVEDGNDLCLLSSLVEENPFSRRSRLHQLIDRIAEKNNQPLEWASREWFQAFLQNVVKPFLDLASQHGILLGAHMQNLILRVQDDWPVGVVYKDCQGTGFSTLGYESFAGDFDFIKKDNGNILNEEETNKVFLYYLAVNSTFSVISSLAFSKENNELRYLTQFRNFLFRELQSSPKDDSVYRFLLNSDFVYQKRNFYCCVNDFNETTMETPWSIYNRIENPLKTRLRTPASVPEDVYYSRFVPRLGKTLTLRSFDMEKDMQKFYQWHHKEYVSEFWELDKSFDELREKVTQLKKSPYELPVIYEVDGEQVGYFELYWAFDDRIAPYCSPDLYDRGLHLLIGEEKFLRSRYVTEGIVTACHFLFDQDSRTKNIWGEPRHDNKKIQKIAEALPGWSMEGFFDFPHKRSALLQCRREDFFKEMESWDS